HVCMTSPPVRADDDGDLVDHAPAPILSGLDRAQDRMPRFARVPGRMPARRAVKAADLPARLAHARLHPTTAGPQALLAPLDGARGLGDTDLVEVRADRRHGSRPPRTVASCIRNLPPARRAPPKRSAFPLPAPPGSDRTGMRSNRPAASPR